MTDPSDIPTGLHSGFLHSAARHPNRPALDVDGRVYSYTSLRDQVLNVAHAIDDCLHASVGRRVGVLANRSLPTYTGLLGALTAGCAVVPLNPGFPIDRTKQMMAFSSLSALVVDDKGARQLDDLLEGREQPLLILLPDMASIGALARRWPAHRFVVASSLARSTAFAPRSAEPDALAYLFFTSGSTGTPKGVGVLHRNVLRFVAMSVERYRADGIGEEDRFSQFYDITFDSSMFDLYVCWALGACL